MTLSAFSYVVLTLVGRGGATAPELVDMMNRGRLYWAASRSQWFAEPRKLAQGGYLSAVEEPGVTGPRVRYMLTAKGRRAVAAWVRTPAGLPRMQQEAVVRVLAVDLVDDPGDVLVGLAHVRDEIAETRDVIAAGRAAAEDLPDRAPRLLAQHTMTEALLDAYERWLDDVEEIIGG